jgi:hypothetical protein
MYKKILYADIIICIAQIVISFIYFYVRGKFEIDLLPLSWLLFTRDGEYLLFLNLPFLFAIYYVYLVAKEFFVIVYLIFAILNQALLYFACWLIFINAIDKASKLATGAGIDM